MAFDFNTFGTTPDTSTKKVGGFDFNTFGGDEQTSVVPLNRTADQKSAQDYNALFPAKTGDSPIKAGFKALGNIPTSAFNLAKGLGTAILNPIDTLKGIGTTAVGGVQKLIPGEQAQEQNFDQLTSFLKERYGSLENLQRTATNDPFGFGTDILGIIAGGASVAGKSAQLSKGIGAVGKTVTEPVAATAKSVGAGISKTTKFGTSQATGLNPETISNIIENPKAFTPQALKETSRVNLGGVVKEAIDTRLDNLSDIGSGYEAIRQTPSVVSVPQGTVQSVLKKYGIEVVDGKVKTTAEAKPLTTADKVALEDFINVYGNEPQLSANAFLNARSGLSQLSKYDAAKTGNLNVIARDLRGVYDELGKGQIKGLSELDAAYAPEVKALNQIKKDYLTSTGEFKDGAINKIANLTGVGKEQVLNRLEQIVPGVTQRIKIVKAAEDIERASGLKVGTYARAGLGVFGVSTLNVPAILTAIIASPEVAVRLLKAYGYTKKTAEPITKSLYAMANDVNNFRLPGGVQSYISEYLKNPKMGMSIEDITRSQPELIPKGKNIKEIQKPLSSVNTTTKAPVKSIVEEAKKYKSAEMVTDKPITVYRGEGKGIGNTTYVKGQYFAGNEEFAKVFGNVKKETIPAGSKIFDFDTIKNTNKLPQEILVDPNTLTKYLTDKGYNYTKNTNTRGVEYVKLNKEYNELLNLALESKDKLSWNRKFIDVYDKYRDEINRLSGKQSASDVVHSRNVVDTIWDNARKINTKLLSRIK